MTQLVLPPDVFWLLKVRVKQGEATPFHLWLIWHHQFLIAKAEGAS